LTFFLKKDKDSSLRKKEKKMCPVRLHGSRFVQKGDALALDGRITSIEDLQPILDELILLSEKTRTASLSHDELSDLTQLLESTAADAQALLHDPYCCNQHADLAKRVVCMANRLCRQLESRSELVALRVTA